MEQPAPAAARADRWTRTLAAADAFSGARGAPDSPAQARRDREHGGDAHPLKVGVGLVNAWQQRAALPPEWLDALAALGVRWT
ncbi:hypothetical protein [Streptomyces sp. SID3343]|uniref:hypothetical protein n=1 Tax=Streptomyces sp. SID3343 TaxID=2690260 RepID=UPI001F378B19|nr:hypothetical protein [Streptomyces sp. SID3343]